jgi:quinol monooxygenase YgiN
MVIVHVHIHVKAELVEEFLAASVENARNSIQEPGIARFDVVQQSDDATRFVFVEVYRNPEAAAAHKQTAHYATWRDAAEPMMAEPRSRVTYTNAFPDDRGW